jgi:hypothetical protein
MTRPELICIALAIVDGEAVRIVRLPALPVTTHEDGTIDCHVFLSTEYVSYLTLRAEQGAPAVRDTMLFTNVTRDDSASQSPSWTQYDSLLSLPALALVNNPAMALVNNPAMAEDSVAMPAGALIGSHVQPQTLATPLAAPVQARPIEVSAGPRDMYSGLPPGAMPRPQNHAPPPIDGIAQAVAAAPTVTDPNGNVRSVFGKAKMSQYASSGPRATFQPASMAMMRQGANGTFDPGSVLASLGVAAGATPGQKPPRVFMKGADGRSRNITPEQWEKQQHKGHRLEDALTDLLGPASDGPQEIQALPEPPEPPQKPLSIGQGGALYGYSAAAGGGAPAVNPDEENFDNLPDISAPVTDAQVAAFEGSEVPAPGPGLGLSPNQSAAPIPPPRLQLVPAQARPAQPQPQQVRQPSPDGDFGAMGGRPV